LFPAGTVRGAENPSWRILEQLIEALEAEATEERAELDRSRAKDFREPKHAQYARAQS